MSDFQLLFLLFCINTYSGSSVRSLNLNVNWWDLIVLLRSLAGRDRRTDHLLLLLLLSGEAVTCRWRPRYNQQQTRWDSPQPITALTSIIKLIFFRCSSSWETETPSSSPVLNKNVSAQTSAGHVSQSAARVVKLQRLLGENIMYLWRFSIALTLGLVWYFSDCGRTLIQYFLCFLFCFSTPRLLQKIRRESSTQTDEETKEIPLQVLNKCHILPWLLL